MLLSFAHNMLFPHTLCGTAGWCSRPCMHAGECMCTWHLGHLPSAPVHVAALHLLGMKCTRCRLCKALSTMPLPACLLAYVLVQLPTAPDVRFASDHHRSLRCAATQQPLLLRSAVVALCQLRWRLLLHDAGPRGQVLPDGGPAVCGTPAGRLHQCTSSYPLLGCLQWI
jgi:hypothetical protein